MTTLALAIATKGEWDPGRLLQILREAGIGPSDEVHVACDPAHAPVTSAPGLTIHLRDKASLFELWALAIERTNADWIAILHADALPAPGWLEAMQVAIAQEEWPDGYWGPVDPDFGTSDARMIGYLTEYVQFHWPVDTRMTEVPGSNLLLPRKRLGSPGGDFSKTRLLGEGLAPRYVDPAHVRYSRPFRLAEYCGRRFRHGRAYAAKRMPRPSLIKAIPMTLVLPALRTGRIIGHGWRYRQFRLPCLRWLPAILLVETFWSAGELIGYVTGRPGDPSRLD